MGVFMRSFPLEDISIGAGGDGRTVTAYAAVFDTPTAVRDQDGQYLEVIDRTAFNRTIAHRGTSFGVFYNHARTLSGTPSDLYSMPLGKPLEVRADARGVLTVTRYNKNPLADQVLESIRNGDLSGQSFSGKFVQSDPARPRTGYMPAPDGTPATVRRMEVALTEYGPTPFPYYETAAIVGVRSEDGLYPPTPRQENLKSILECHVEAYGQFDQSTGPNGAHYAAPSPFAAEGMVCANCTMFEGPRACEIVAGDIDPGAVCKFWIIPADLLTSSGTTSADGQNSGRHSGTGILPLAALDSPTIGHASRHPSLRRKAREIGAI